MPDSFDMQAIGRQHDSKKETMPAFSFGSCGREKQAKVFISEKHEVRKATMNSPGPVYSPPTTVGESAKYGFGSDRQRWHPKAKYPDTSVDLTGATVDSQVVKFHSTKQTHFGTESKATVRNAEIIRTNPSAALGMESPGCMEYTPKDRSSAQREPEYSFGPGAAKVISDKITSRMSAPPTSTPRHVGPGSHTQPASIGSQPSSVRKTAAQYSFGGQARGSPRGDLQLLDISPDLSSLGRQVISSARSAPKHGFGSSTRDHSARTHLVFTDADRGPAAHMPKPNFPCDLPPPQKAINRPGV